MYITIVIVTAAKYIVTVDPTSATCHTFDPVASTLSRQCSAHVCARSTSKISPNSRNNTAPTSAT